MSQFMTDLFKSIFTPGPTPTLIVATNITFAALQLLFFVLLVATYSIHFLILSCLSAGLWWAINWFVAELRIAQAAEAERERQKARDAPPSDETDTEAETVVESSDMGAWSTEVEPVAPAEQGDLKDRRHPSGNKSEASTEDEWEKVSENEKDK